MEWYRKGIEELNKGIEIVCDEEGTKLIIYFHLNYTFI